MTGKLGRRALILRLLIGIPLGLVALLVAAIAVFTAWNWTYVRAFPAILPGFYAKEFCSCRFVMNQDDAYCRIYARQWLPTSEVVVDEALRRVEVRGLGVGRSARHLGGREGCRLEN